MVKLLTKSLPLGKVLKRRKKTLYAELKCSSCNYNDQEDWTHLLTCPSRARGREQIYTELKKALQTLIQQHQKEKLPEYTINNISNQLLGHTHEAIEFKDFFSMASELKITSSFFNILCKETKLPRSKKLLITTDLLRITVFNFKKFIWIPRCEDLAQWEKKQNITTKDKCSKDSTITSDTISTKNKSTDTPQVLDDIDNHELHSLNKLEKNLTLTKLDRCIQAVKICKDQMVKYIRYNVYKPWMYKTSNILNGLAKTLDL